MARIKKMASGIRRVAQGKWHKAGGLTTAPAAAGTSYQESAAQTIAEQRGDDSRGTARSKYGGKDEAGELREANASI